MKYFRGLLCILLMAPLGVFALGVGELKTSSALNEPFEAKIKLVSATPADLVSLKVLMADNAAFERAGIERNYALSDLKFEVVEPEKGDDYIRVYSSQPIREPFLNFLLEVSWNNGRVFREFTVLLDPPLYDPNRRKLVKQTTTPATAPSSVAVTEEVEGVVTEDAFEEYAKSQKAGVSVSSQGDYGPVAQSESLWSIAASSRPNDSVSVNQMMMALYKANPEAFYNNNINGLKRGSILKIPNATEISALTAGEANSAVASQHQSWSGFVETPASEDVSQRTETISTTTTPTETQKKKTIPEKSEPSLKLVSPTEGQSGSDQASDSGQAATGSNTDLTLAEEAIEALSMENAELKDKLLETESIIEDLNRLIEVQSDELTALRNQLAQIDSTIPEATVEPETTEAETNVVDEDVDNVVEEETVPETELSVDADEDTVTEELEAAEAETEVDADAEAESTEDVVTEGAELEEEIEINVADTSGSSSDSLMDTAMGYIEPVKDMVTDLIGDSKEMLYAVVGFFVLILLFVLNKLRGGNEKTLDEIRAEEEKGSFISNLMAKFKKDDDAEEDVPDEEKESLKDKITYFIERITGRAEKPEEVSFDADQPSMISELAGDTDEEEAEPSPAAFEESEEITDVPEETAVPEAVTADFEGLDGTQEAFEEDDSLQEVNTYLAFEQYDEAESFVRGAIAEHPNRPDYHLKLLEVFYTSANKQAYEEEAKVLNDIVGGQGDAWDNANAMWNEMSPNRALFEAGGDDDSDADDALSQSAGGGGMLDLTAETEDAATESSLDFDIGSPTEMSDEEPEPEPEPEPEDDNMLDMPMPDEDDPMEATAAMPNTQMSEVAEEDDNALDFDMSLGADLPEAADSQEEEVDHQAEISLDMPSAEPEEIEIPDPVDEAVSQDEIETAINVNANASEAELEMDLPEESEPEVSEVDLEANELELDLEASSDDLSLDIPGATDADSVEDDDASLDLDIGDVGTDAVSVESSDTSDLLNVTKSGHIEPDEDQDLLDVTAAIVEIEGEDDLGLDELSVPNETEEDLMKHISSDNSDMDDGDNVIDFDAAMATKEAAEEDEGIELDLDISESSNDAEAEPEQEVANDVVEEEEFSLDLEIDDGLTSESSVSASSDEEPVSEFSLDLDLPSESSEVEDDISSVEEDVVDFDGTVEIPKMDTAPEVDDDDFDEEDEDDKTVFVPRSAPAASQSDEDENAAKLDLAKAYVELGDNDSARSILDEVVESGSEQQQQQAKELLSQI